MPTASSMNPCLSMIKEKIRILAEREDDPKPAQQYIRNIPRYMEIPKRFPYGYRTLLATWHKTLYFDEDEQTLSFKALGCKKIL